MNLPAQASTTCSLVLGTDAWLRKALPRGCHVTRWVSRPPRMGDIASMGQTGTRVRRGYRGTQRLGGRRHSPRGATPTTR